MSQTVSPQAILSAINMATAGGRRGSSETFDRQVAFVFSLNPTDQELRDAAAELNRSARLPHPPMPHSDQFMENLDPETLLESAQRGDAGRQALADQVSNGLEVIDRVRAVAAHARKMPAGRWVPPEARPFT